MRAFAGAWTLPEGGLQIIAGPTYATADAAFDNDGDLAIPVSYNKLLLKAYVQYGLWDRLTLFADPEFAIAHETPAIGKKSEAKDVAFGGGARFRLTDAIGTLSLEASGKTAGAFNLSVSSNGVSGSQGEVRLLYGSNFSLSDRDAFLDVQVGHRWVSGGRPNEVPIDVTLGWHYAPKWILMLQSFNIVSGSARAPYSYYRSHKLEFSAVYNFSEKYGVQFGAYTSPAGQNALQERGVAVSLWINL
ncbi:MAG TPA: hypothetical protein VHL34_13220 [Rhizomicrobium sp.]|nr:hypothetical protein [Rhizomicrobium sp.]